MRISTKTNLTIQGDLNKVLFCSGMFSYKKANEYAKKVFSSLYKAFVDYKENGEEEKTQISVAGELKKFKELLDDGAITQEEYDKKKKELLNL